MNQSKSVNQSKVGVRVGCSIVEEIKVTVVGNRVRQTRAWMGDLNLT